MPKQNRGWIYDPSWIPNPGLPEGYLDEVEGVCRDFLEERFKPTHIHPESNRKKDLRLVDIFTKQRQNYIYFHGRYDDRRPNVIKPSWNTKLARIEALATDHFALSYFRHTGKWWEVQRGISLGKCLDEIEDSTPFHPF